VYVPVSIAGLSPLQVQGQSGPPLLPLLSFLFLPPRNHLRALKSIQTRYSDTIRDFPHPQQSKKVALLQARQKLSHHQFQTKEQFHSKQNSSTVIQTQESCENIKADDSAKALAKPESHTC